MTQEPLETANIPTQAGRFSVQVASTLVVRVVMVCSSVAAGVIVARWLGASALGILAVVNVTIATLVQIGSFGIPSANIYFISRDQSALRSAAVKSFWFALLVGSALAGALLILAKSFPAWFDPVPYNLLFVAAMAIPCQLLILVGINIFLAVGDVTRFNSLELGSQIFVLLNAAFAVVVLRSGVGLLVTLNTIVAALSATVIWILVFQMLKKRKPAEAVVTLSALLRYGLKFHVSILAGALIVRADLLVVNYFRGPAEAGVYSVASQVGLMLMLLPGVIATILFPRATAEQDTTGVRTSLIARHAGVVMFLICVATIPASFVLPWIYGAGFSDLPFLILILLPGVLLIGIESVLVQHFNAMGLPRAIPVFWIVTLAIDVVLLFVLVPRFGARGAAAASTLSYTLIFLLVAGYFRAKTTRSISEILLPRPREWRELFTTLLRSRAVSGSPEF